MDKNFEIKTTTGFGKAIYMMVTEDGKEPVITATEYNVPDSVPPLATVEAALAWMDGVQSDIDKLALAWAEAAAIKDLATSAEIMKDAKKLASLYNTASLTEAIMDCGRDEKPMLKAVIRELYPTLSVGTGEDRDTKVEFMKVVKRMKRIPLDKLHKKCSGIGVDKNWYYEAQSFNKLLVARAMVDADKEGKLTIEEALKQIDDSFAMDKIAKEIKYGKNPTSNTNLLKTLRKLICMMIGEEYESEVRSHDINTLNSRYLTECKADPSGLTAEAKTNKKFYDLCLVIAHRVATGGSYSVYCKELDRKK